MNTQNPTLLSPRHQAKSIDAGIELRIALPGAEKSAVTLTARAGELIVEAPRNDLDRKALYRISFKTGDRLDATQSRATHADGVLQLLVPLAEGAKPSRIEID